MELSEFVANESLWERPMPLIGGAFGKNVSEDFLKASALKRASLRRPCWENYFRLLASLPAELVQKVEFKSGVVCLGEGQGLTEETKHTISLLAKELIPWRKGPLEIGGHFIDCEWRSDFKWERLKPHLPEIEGKRVLDVGCGNGYYMFRMLEHGPRAVLGLDPSEKFFLAFELLQRFAGVQELEVEMLGVEDLSGLKNAFELIFFMGVLYHRRDPHTAIRLLADSLRPGGELLIETQGYPGEDAVMFVPPGRYAKANNVYFLPTVSGLKNLLFRNGFKEIELLDESITNFEEQRRTKYAPFESLEDFLDKKDPSRTIEGHPAPRRFLMLAKKA